MTPEERTAQLENRVDRLEDQYRNDIATIHSKIDILVTTINASSVAVAKNACPSPGACIGLSSKLEAAIVAHTSTMLRVERLELRILAIETWQWKTIGAIGVIMATLMTLFTLFGPSLRHLLNLP